MSGQIAATVQNIAAHEGLFRLGILADLFTGSIGVFIAFPFQLGEVATMLAKVWRARYLSGKKRGAQSGQSPWENCASDRWAI